MWKKTAFPRISLPNAKVRPLVGESVFVRGVIIVFGSPIKYDGRKLLVLAAEGLDGLPRVIGSIVIGFLSNKRNKKKYFYWCYEHNQTFVRTKTKIHRKTCLLHMKYLNKLGKWHESIQKQQFIH